MLKRLVHGIANGFNGIAAAAVVAMMVLTCADVVLRFFRRPIPGTYEIIGLLGAMFAAFSLAYTSLERGHIAVDFLVQRLSPRTQNIVEGINALICAALFGLVTWQSVLYAGDLQGAGEVSMTLQMPIYPFVYGIAIGCGMLCVVLLMRAATMLTRIRSTP